MASYTIGDSVYASGPFPVAYFGTVSATLAPISIGDVVYPTSSGYAVNLLSTELAELKPLAITDTVWSALSYAVDFLSTSGSLLQPFSTQGLFQAYVTTYSPQFVSTEAASLKPRSIPDTFVFSLFTKSVPSSGQIWPRRI